MWYETEEWVRTGLEQGLTSKRGHQPSWSKSRALSLSFFWGGGGGKLAVNNSGYILQQEVSVQELLSPSPATDETLWFFKI
jgi:hypothetical protein